MPEERSESNASFFSSFTGTSKCCSSEHSSNHSSNNSDILLTARRPSCWIQLLTAIQRDVTERRRAWLELLLELLIPLFCMACTTFLWCFFGNNTGVEESFVNYSVPTQNSGVQPYNEHFCYNDSMRGPDGRPNVIPGLQPCSRVAFPFSCQGDETDLPYKGLCMDISAIPTLLFVNSVLGELNIIPPLDDLLLLHWGFHKNPSFGADTQAFRQAGVYLVDRFSSLATVGSVLIGPSHKVPLLLLDYFRRNSLYFDSIYGGGFTDEDDMNDKISNMEKKGEKIFAIIIINNITGDDFDVEIKMNQVALPAPQDTMFLDYSGGVVLKSADMYIVSGFLTLQKMLYEFYMESVKIIPPKKRQFTPYVVSMGSIGYNVPQLIRQPAMLIAFLMTLSPLYPVTLLARQRVVEKELRIREIMQIMGIRTYVLDISWFLLGSGKMFFFSLFTTVILRPYIHRTAFIVVFMIFLVHSLALIPFAGFISSLFNHSRMVSMMVPLIYFAASLPPVGLQLASSGPKTGFCLIPLTSFSLSLQLLFQHELTNGLSVKDFKYIFDQPNLLTIIGVTIGDFFLYLLLMVYLDMVIPKEYGQSKHPLFFILEPIRWCRGEGTDVEEVYMPDGRDPNGIFESKENSLVLENEETERGKKKRLSSHNALDIFGLRKEFKRGSKTFVAVNNLYWSMARSGTSVLLGHNGAGKSTIINMITGMLPPDGGDCFIYGYSIKRDMSVVRQNIALCPQHNLLWPNLTCREHLEFFGRIKGLRGDDLEMRVLKMLNEVDLYDKIDYKSSSLSGGQKRKLSVACAFVGGSHLVLLDEPTAGMDVVARRHTWELLRRMSRTHAILLTTHFMDEAEILGDEIAIMSHGALKCSGSVLFLKSRMAADYNLDMSLTPDSNIDSIYALIHNYIPGIKKVFAGSTEWQCRIPAGSIDNLVPLLRRLESSSKEFGVGNYSLSGMTLEDVFMQVVEQDDYNNTNSSKRRNKAWVRYEGDDFNDEYDLEEMERVEDSPGACVWNCGVESNERAIMSMQFRALMKKRIVSSYRDWQVLTFQIICPVICVLLAMILDSLKFKHPTVVELSPSMFPFDTKSDVVGCSSYFNNTQYVSPPLKNPPPYIGGSGGSRTMHISHLNMTHSYDLSWYHVDNYLNHDLHHFNSFTCNDSCYKNLLLNQSVNNPVVLFYNTSVLHGVPTALNTLYHMIIQHNHPAGDTKMKISMSHISTSDLMEVGNVVQTIFKGMLIMIPFTILPSNCISWVVMEKEFGVRHLQYLSGLNYFVYWAVNFVFDITAYLITIVLVFLIFLMFGEKAYVSSKSFLPTLLLFLCYGMTGISMAYLLHFLFKSRVKAQSVVMILCVSLGYVSLTIVYVFDLINSTKNLSKSLRWPSRLMPTYALGEGLINLISLKQHQAANRHLTAWSMETVGWSCIFMAIEFPIFTIITLVIDHPEILLKIRKLSYKPDGENLFNDEEEDTDVEEERDYVCTHVMENDIDMDAVTALNLRKVYDNGKEAVKKLTFGVVKGEVFGFLGTNGAGKTTTLSILSQEALPTSGRAFICGYDVVRESKMARSLIGYCPQFDACLELLTVQEHLYMYACIRGILKNQQEEVVESLMYLCGINDYRETKSKELSGGNRRKLSLAICLINAPRIVILDEPSAGMDPVARRSVWKIIREMAKHASVLLTTHHLEEIEALASCVGIMVDGTLRCLGNKTHLKHKFGTGVEMRLKSRDSAYNNKILKFVKTWLSDAELKELRGERFIYSLPQKMPLSHVFEVLQQHKAALGITDYSISQTSIEQVFMKISEEALDET